MRPFKYLSNVRELVKVIREWNCIIEIYHAPTAVRSLREKS